MEENNVETPMVDEPLEPVEEGVPGETVDMPVTPEEVADAVV